MVCDHRQDCQDNSDEQFCQFAPCPLDMMKCGASKQCYSIEEECNGQYDCLNSADEAQCADSVLNPLLQYSIPVMPLPPPAVVTLNGKGMYQFQPLDTESCPDSHFQCFNDGYCLPVYVRCNGVYDCPVREDEAGCSTDTLCPGLYRCRGSPVCLHHSHVCDGIIQCPQFDDEVWCNMTCPPQCQCWGLAYVCRNKFPAEKCSDLRYVDASESNMTMQDFEHHVMLIHLRLAGCQLSNLGNASFNNLHSLDLSHNFLNVFSMADFNHFPLLRVLFLSGNPMEFMFGGLPKRTTFRLYHLDLSGVKISEFNLNDMDPFPQLRILNVSGCRIEKIFNNDDNYLKKMSVFDLRGCGLYYFPRHVFKRLVNLKSLYADNFKICCTATLPDGFNLNECHAPFDEISSCEALLRFDIYRVFLSIAACIALTGNLASFAFRSLREGNVKSSFHVFVTHLCIADFLMGIYLSIVGVADRLYLDNYLWEDTSWRHSVTCKLAGVICLMSSELSVFIICLITIDRFLMLQFPFSQLRFHYRTAQITAGLMWLISCILASVPLFPNFSFYHFYSRVGMCIPLPITRKDFEGKDYAFGIMIVLNFVIFIIIVVGQGLIYQTVRINSLEGSVSNKQSTDTTIARRLITIAVSDFLCWFPVGILGIMASQGVPISGEVNVVLAVFVLPLNSVINPFLYTLNTLMEQRQKNKEAKILKWLKEL